MLYLHTKSLEVGHEVKSEEPVKPQESEWRADKKVTGETMGDDEVQKDSIFEDEEERIHIGRRYGTLSW
jgi:hypothetical protein